ncbi:MAG: lipoyl domain-containing protein [Bradyrhizobiaceae bacterium]|nr:lipoyl domain-containing protein [Bradyrhizobiaceae bacterium]
MKIKLKLTRVGMNMSEATIVEWHKQPGDRFDAGDSIYSFETEKVAQEVEATAPGIMIEILVPKGQNANVGQEVCIVDVELQK